MNILAIDTATEACSAALTVGGDTISRFEIAPRRHGELILSMIESLLVEAGYHRSQIALLAFGCGPGAFTGVRMATGIAQGIAYGLDVPLTGVSNLQILAQGAKRQFGCQQVLSGFDARMGEVYWGAYQYDDVSNLMQPIFTDSVCAPEKVTLPTEGQWLGAGTAWDSYANELSRRLGNKLNNIEKNVFPHAQDCLAIARWQQQQRQVFAASEAVPVYLRNNVAAKSIRSTN